MEVKVITVVGLNSGKQVLLDIEAITYLINWYLKDAPKEDRVIKIMLQVMRMHDNLADLLAKEVEGARKKMETKFKEELANEYLDGSEGLGLLDTGYKAHEPRGAETRTPPEEPASSSEGFSSEASLSDREPQEN